MDHWESNSNFFAVYKRIQTQTVHSRGEMSESEICLSQSLLIFSISSTKGWKIDFYHFELEQKFKLKCRNRKWRVLDEDSAWILIFTELLTTWIFFLIFSTQISPLVFSSTSCAIQNCGWEWKFHFLLFFPYTIAINNFFNFKKCGTTT